MHARSVFLIPSDDLGWSVVRTMLREKLGVTIIGEATSAREAREVIAATHPDVVLAAGIIEDVPARHLLRELRQTSCPTTRFAVFVAALDPEDVLPFAAIGLAGHLLWQDLSCATLPACLATVVESAVIVGSPTVVQAFVEAQRVSPLASPDSTAPSHDTRKQGELTRRQRNVLRLVAEELTNDEIAMRLSLSPKTVKKHLDDIYHRLGVHDRMTAARRAHECGYLI